MVVLSLILRHIIVSLQICPISGLCQRAFAGIVGPEVSVGWTENPALRHWGSVWTKPVTNSDTQRTYIHQTAFCDRELALEYKKNEKTLQCRKGMECISHEDALLKLISAMKRGSHPCNCLCWSSLPPDAVCTGTWQNLGLWQGTSTLSDECKAAGGMCWTASKLHVLVFVSRTIPKFIKKPKASDYKDKNVFGVPLLLNVQRTSHPLPNGILQALEYLRSHFLDQVWTRGSPGQLWAMNRSAPGNQTLFLTFVKDFLAP